MAQSTSPSYGIGMCSGFIGFRVPFFSEPVAISPGKAPGIAEASHVAATLSRRSRLRSDTQKKGPLGGPKASRSKSKACRCSSQPIVAAGLPAPPVAVAPAPVRAAPGVRTPPARAAPGVRTPPVRTMPEAVAPSPAWSPPWSPAWSNSEVDALRGARRRGSKGAKGDGAHDPQSSEKLRQVPYHVSHPSLVVLPSCFVQPTPRSTLAAGRSSVPRFLADRVRGHVACSA